MFDQVISFFSTLFKNQTKTTGQEMTQINKTAPKNKKELEALVGTFQWREDTTTRGAIKILGDWEVKNIVLLTLPFNKVGQTKQARIQVHKAIKDNVIALFNDYYTKQYHISYPIRVMGGYVPRHMYWDPKKPLSIHSYGIAIDINWDTNPTGNHPGDMPKYVVDLFKSYGWTWGGDWKALDRMHFEFYVE